MHTYHKQPGLKSIEKPLHDLMELNVKTFQKLYSVNPTDLMKAHKPEEFLEKNVELLIENGHKTLDYVHDLFCIFESQWFNASDTMIKNTTETMQKAQKTAHHTMREAVSTPQKIVKKASSRVPAKTKKKAKPSLSASQRPTKLSSKKTTIKKAAFSPQMKKAAGARSAAKRATH